MIISEFNVGTRAYVVEKNGLFYTVTCNGGVVQPLLYADGVIEYLSNMAYFLGNAVDKLENKISQM